MTIVEVCRTKSLSDGPCCRAVLHVIGWGLRLWHLCGVGGESQSASNSNSLTRGGLHTCMTKRHADIRYVRGVRLIL